jgi:hypothetical protein
VNKKCSIGALIDGITFTGEDQKLYAFLWNSMRILQESWRANVLKNTDSKNSKREIEYDDENSEPETESSNCPKITKYWTNVCTSTRKAFELCKTNNLSPEVFDFVQHGLSVFHLNKFTISETNDFHCGLFMIGFATKVILFFTFRTTLFSNYLQLKPNLPFQ